MANDRELADKAQRLAEALEGRDCRLAVAESCTGGWIGKCLTDLAGCSSWFEGGVVCYSNAAKQALLGVSDQALAEFGAVSEAVATELVRGAVERFDADVGVAVTGIAGPSGGTADKPVGSVWFGWYAGDGTVTTQRVVLDGDREAVRRETVAAALDGLLEQLQ